MTDQIRVDYKLDIANYIRLSDKSRSYMIKGTAYKMRQVLLVRHPNWVQTTRPGYWRRHIIYVSSRKTAAFGFDEKDKLQVHMTWGGQRREKLILIPITPEARKMRKTKNLIQRQLKKSTKSKRYFLKTINGTTGIWEKNTKTRKIRLVWLIVRSASYRQRRYAMTKMIEPTRKMMTIKLRNEMRRQGLIT